MCTTLSELIQWSRARAVADGSWLGSEEQREMLERSLETVFCTTDVTVEWARPGDGSFWEPASRVLTFEQPRAHAGASAADVAEFAALGVLHEALHARYTTSLGSYPRRREALPSQLRPAVERLFNLLEDYRITALGTDAQPELAPPLERFMDEAARQVAVEARSRQGDPDTAGPRSQQNQLFFALLTRALRPQQSLTLHPNVERRLDELLPLVDRARTGSTEDCGLAAVATVEAVMETPLPT
jgi:hypothetical protein